MKRGDIVLVSDGKTRPAIVLQRDEFDATSHVMVAPLTSELREGTPALRIDIVPDIPNGLEQQSQVMIDRCGAVDRRKVFKVVGRIDVETLRAIEQALLVLIGIV